MTGAVDFVALRVANLKESLQSRSSLYIQNSAATGTWIPLWTSRLLHRKFILIPNAPGAVAAQQRNPALPAIFPKNHSVN
jgi:hypothetical protein